MGSRPAGMDWRLSIHAARIERCMAHTDEEAIKHGCAWPVAFDLMVLVSRKFGQIKSAHAGGLIANIIGSYLTLRFFKKPSWAKQVRTKLHRTNLFYCLRLVWRSIFADLAKPRPLPWQRVNHQSAARHLQRNGVKNMAVVGKSYFWSCAPSGGEYPWCQSSCCRIFPNIIGLCDIRSPIAASYHFG